MRKKSEGIKVKDRNWNFVRNPVLRCHQIKKALKSVSAHTQIEMYKRKKKKKKMIL